MGKIFSMMKMVFITVVLLTLTTCGYAENSGTADSSRRQESSCEAGTENVHTYTAKFCGELLSTSLADLADRYNIDLEKEPSGGLLLEGRTISTPVVQLGKEKVFLICDPPYPLDKDEKPLALLLFGDNCDYTQIESDTFHFGMNYKDINQNLYECTDSFIKACEGCEKAAAKHVAISVEDLLFELSFLPDSNEKNKGLYLDYIQVSLQNRKQEE